MKRMLWLLTGMGVVGVAAGGWWWYERETVPPPLHLEPIWPLVEAYPITDMTGGPPPNLRGKVVLLNFIYTRCPSVCPRLQSQIRLVLQQIPPTPALVAVSISLDPEHDTPEYLRAYAKSYEVPGHTWLFWRPANQAWAIQLAASVFGLRAARLSETEILHSDVILLIDSEGRLRGWYASTDDRLLKHTQNLLRLCER
ncbi:MAG: SCO family protein [Bacteroidia bacterium]|nr:SCO family protein [Bacteroidia bacterium]